MASSLLVRSEVQLAATALVSGLVVAAAILPRSCRDPAMILGYQELSCESRLDWLKRSIPDAEKDHATIQPPLFTIGNKSRLPMTAEMYDTAAHALAADDACREDALAMTLADHTQLGDFDPDLITKALARNAAFFSAMAEQQTTNGDGVAAATATPNRGGALSIPPLLTNLRASFVVVVGLGGVGSHCCMALARSDVGRIRVVDFGQVRLSLLNQHAVATLADISTSKMGCMRRRLAAVAPWVRVQERGVKFDLEDEPARRR